MRPPPQRRLERNDSSRNHSAIEIAVVVKAGRWPKRYDADITEDCERVLVALLRGLGPWKDSVYLVGGLAPRYIVKPDPERPFRTRRQRRLGS
ncbi:hypothetical protein ATDW_23970 [Asticcacaulis sp. DW145]|nr:hypothetical protein ATDW_23970 [Asticcacaulis sp. DW145]